MPYCPKCKAKFKDGFTRCDYCDEDLVEQLTQPEAPENHKEIFDFLGPQPELKNEVPLTTVDSTQKFAYLIAELNAKGIIFKVAEQEVGTYMSMYIGSESRGLTIYVEMGDYSKALGIVYSYKPKENE